MNLLACLIKTSALSVIIFLLIGGIPAFAQSKAVIRISAETAVDSDRVTLGDIAEISGANEETKTRLQKIALGYAPNIGMTREIFKDKILLSIAAAGFAKTDFAFIAPPKIFVRRTAQTVNQNQLRAAIEQAVLGNFQNENIEAKIVRLDLPADIQTPSGNVEIRVGKLNAANLFLPFSVALEILIDEKIVRRTSATVQVEASAEILVAARDLVSGEKITETDVKKEIRRLEKPLNYYLRDASKLRGNVLTKNLSDGAAMTSDTVAAGYVIRGGDSVRIVGESGKMQIIINGEARSSGRIGDRIAVKNLQSGTILQATIVDEGLVKVLF